MVTFVADVACVDFGCYVDLTLLFLLVVLLVSVCLGLFCLRNYSGGLFGYLLFGRCNCWLVCSFQLGFVLGWYGFMFVT